MARFIRRQTHGCALAASLTNARYVRDDVLTDCCMGVLLLIEVCVFWPAVAVFSVKALLRDDVVKYS